MPQAPHETSPESRARKTNRGCWIALIALFTVMTAAAVVGVFVVTRLIEDSPVPKWGKRLGEGADIVLDSQSNGGAEAMRSEGCTRSSMFLDAERTFDFLDDLNEGGPLERPAGLPKHVAICIARPGSAAPRCDEIAKAITRAKAASGEFSVVVSDEKGRAQAPDCSRRYDTAGKDLGPYDSNTVPMPQ